MLWTSPVAKGSNPFTGNNLVYSTFYSSSESKSYLIALDQATGTEKWRYAPTKGSLETASISLDGTSIAFISSPSVLGEGYVLYVLDAITGKLRWEKSVYNNNFSLIVGAKVYVRTGTINDATITAFDVNTGSKVWESRSLGVSLPGPMCVITADGKTYYMPESGMRQ